MKTKLSEYRNMAVIKKNGKTLEKVVRLIHETLKDRPDTVIRQNHKIKNIAGRKREFDLFIEVKVNGIKLIVVVECKEYRHPVSVEKIEAFKGKCDRVPAINKKIFVSQSGYQADAINAAKEFGIDLYDLKEIDSEVILTWFPINQLGLRFDIRKFEIVVDTPESEFNSIAAEKITSFYFNGETDAQDVIKLVNDSVFDNKRLLWNINLIEFMKNGGRDSIGRRTTLPFQIELQEAYILSKNGTRFPIVGIAGEIDSWFVEGPVQISASQALISEDKIRAGRLLVESRSSQEQTDIIVTEDRFKIFHTDENGLTQELKLLAKFDPKTNTWLDVD